MTKQEVLKLLQSIMPDPGRTYETPDEVVEEIWNNFLWIEKQLTEKKTEEKHDR